MDLSQLLSPPESKPRDQFSPVRNASPHKPQRTSPITSEFTLPPITSALSTDLIMGRLPSPPRTPSAFAARRANRQSSASDLGSDSQDVRDPLLFSRHTPPAHVEMDQPLFPPCEQSSTSTSSQLVHVDPNMDELVTHHMAMHMSQYRHSATKPTRDEYHLALSCVPIVSRKYAQNPQKWLQQERRILDERFSKANRVWKRPITSGLAKLAPAPSHGVKKPTPTGRAPRPPRAAPRTPKRTPPKKVRDSSDGDRSDSPNKRAIGTSREDTDFETLPDYAPPTSTLPQNNPKVLKADWKGQMLDLSRDPHRHLLHEAEVHLAATLRLSCATYLCSKRRIFMARVNALHAGKEFRKTDSQQACKIDVNKASKLWTAYDKVGWFKPVHFQHLR
ncbi:MAG: hypothetical protein M1837_004642 [Sclerophora amabilis]|nr:MAG: hypothetical protein M1837_004642 [Sclerophora amabilis]